MIAKEAMVELVNYRTDQMAEVTLALVANFVKHSDIPGVGRWVGAIFPLIKIIENQKPQELSLKAEGIEIDFSGFPNPRPLIREGSIIYQSREPYFTIEEASEGIMPKERTRITRVASDIAEEIRDVFHVEVVRSPLTLVFPKHQFAKSRKVFKAAIL